MGLDITAYEVAVLTDPHPHVDECYDADHVWAFCYNGFEQSLRGLEQERCYAVSGRRLPFRAGSYSGYNHWRSWLAHAALGAEANELWSDPDAFRLSPFFELINFADNEGTIGPEAAADLAADFDAHAERIAAAAPKDDPFGQYLGLYQEWSRAFHLAAGRGLVRFA